MKGGAGRKAIEIKDFSGGLVTKAPPLSMEPKYCVDAQNVYAQGLMLWSRPGIVAVNPTAATAGVGYGLYNWVRGSASTAQWLMSFWGATLYKMDITGGVWDGVLDAVTADAASGTAFTTAGGVAYFANFNGVLLISNEGRDHIQKITTADSSFFNIEVGGTGTAPLAKFVAVWKNHAWFINCNGSEDQVVHSAVNSYNNFTGSTYGSNMLLTENDIGCTGWFVLNGRLYVTKSFSIHRFTYTGSPSPLVDIRPMKSVIGTRSPRTIKNVSTPDGEMVLMLGSNRKLYSCDGQDVYEQSEKIDVTNGISSFYMQNINAAALNNCFAIVHEDINMYELVVCVGTKTVPDVSIWYNYILKSFWPMTNRNFVYGNISDNAAGKRVNYTQGTNGKIYLVNSGSNDDGSAINAYWISEKLGVPIMLQRIDEIEVQTDIMTSTPTFRWRADWESTWISVTMTSGVNTNNFAPNRIDNMVQFSIVHNSSTETLKLWTILASERPVGGGK